MFKQKKAFTLIELLVVIAIIGILATLAIIALQQARASARDAKRIADVRQMQTALELYYNDNNRYPLDTEFESGQKLLSLATGKILMNEIPFAPNIVDGDCESENYTYTTNDEGSTYSISFCLGRPISSTPEGDLCATPGGITTCNESTEPSIVNACNNETEFIDPRDGTTYAIIAIGDQCWMAENLKYLPAEEVVSNEYDMNFEFHNYYVYGFSGGSIEDAKAYIHTIGDDSFNSYERYGVIYNWGAAVDWYQEIEYENIEGSQGVCPENWHLPSNNDWIQLSDYLDESESMGLCYPVGHTENCGLYWVNAGNYLKSDTWDGDNSSGFNALPLGIKSLGAGFYGFGFQAVFWSSSFSDQFNSWTFRLSSTPTIENYIFKVEGDKMSGSAVRCIKN